MNSRFVSILLSFFLVSLSDFAQTQTLQAKMTRENFMVVVRESIGANRTEDSLVPTGRTKAELPDGKEVELEVAWWDFIGDTHIRFVFDGPESMRNATPRDLDRLGITSVHEALTLALANIKRVYGQPVAAPWEGGLMQVEGRSPDLDSSYFLDRSFWQDLVKKHPEGVVVSVAKRGGLLYVPLSESKAVERLKREVTHLHASSGSLRVSGALFLFKDDRWSVFQAAPKQ